MTAGGLILALTLAAADTLIVSPAGPWRTIGDAVTAAQPHDVILVRRGVYREPTILIARPLTLQGEAGSVIDGEGQRQLVRVEADSVTIRGLTLRNVGTSYMEDRAAITVEDASHCVIEGNRIENAFFGIYLANVGWCRIEDNVLVARTTRETAAGNGIHLWYSKQVLIRGNDVRGHRDGIYFEFVEDSRVERNHAEGNLRYGLHFMFSDRCEYRDNVFRANHAGIAVMYTRNVVMEDNRFEDNRGPAAFGLLLKDITDSRVARNRFTRNTVGIMAEGMNRTELEHNVFSANGWAIKLMANSEDNTFFANDFHGNAFDVSTNSRQNFSTFRNNWWDRYGGYDLDRDGYGDVPFRPVRLFSLIVERNAPSLVLLRSLFVTLLDAAERVAPVLTPATLVDERPRMTRNVR
ncbi:MAG TPA: nitrous oxide reductase family maturation protein NosD [Longimicrobiales bacterium]|nr:nitrous oxide reductase family maturation protein NosD [Longimicrobiales bacterium]